MTRPAVRDARKGKGIRMRRFLRSAAALLLAAAAALGCAPAAAAAAFDSYGYTYWGDPVEAPPIYRAETTWSAALREPGDLFVAADGLIYIADTGNDRIVVLDGNADGAIVRQYDVLTGEGGELTLDAPNGVFVKDDGHLLIADTGHKRVVEIDPAGRLVREYGRPTADVAFSGIDFLPKKVAADRRGFVYALCQGLYQGAVTYKSDGSFVGYFGANEVEVTLKVLTAAFWKSIMSQTQIAKLERTVPEEFSNMDIDERGFLYTCTAVTENRTDQLKLINPQGANIQPKNSVIRAAYARTFGDLQVKYYQGEMIQTRFVDVAHDEDGYVYGLDVTKGRVFQYDKNSHLIGVIGGIGDQLGTFTSVSAVDTLADGRLLVLDAKKNTVTVFVPTAYRAAICAALTADEEGDSAAAQRHWQDVLSHDMNSELAYAGIGGALFDRGDYRGAMRYFRRGGDRDGYAKALEYYRRDAVTAVSPYVLTGLLVLAAAAAVLSLLRAVRRRRQPDAPRPVRPDRKHRVRSFPRLVGYTLFHPGDGFTDFFEKKCWRTWALPVVPAALFLAMTAQRQLTGFCFNDARPSDLNILFILLQTVGLFALWTAANWAVSTLFDGKARLREIWCFSSVALIPFTLSVVLQVVLSRVLIPTESMFLTIVQAVGILWSLLLLAAGLMVFHDYSLGKTVWSSLLTIGLMLVVLFICTLGFSLFQQVFNFVDAVIREIGYRIG